MNHWKKWTWAYDHLKLVICQRITSKNTRPRWVNTWARGTVRWYWSAGALFWQLSIDHNIDVQLVFPWAPKLARKCESRHWFPCGADGRSYGHVITKFSRMGRLPHFLTYGAPPTRALRARVELRYKVETRKKFWIHTSNIVCGVRAGVGPVWIGKHPEMQKCPKTFVHDCLKKR